MLGIIETAHVQKILASAHDLKSTSTSLYESVVKIFRGKLKYQISFKSVLLFPSSYMLRYAQRDEKSEIACTQRREGF